MNQNRKLLAVVGPTASGKSALAHELAKKHNGEIVSCDSMQIYRRMDIGTAKPTIQDMTEIPYHMIDIVEPWENYSCADYVEQASTVIDKIYARGKIPILCGGTGLYLDALLRAPTLHEGEPDMAIREELIQFAEKNGREAVWEELRRVDPQSADEIHPNNVKRVIRALEIYRTGGIPKSELDRRSRETPPRYDATVLALQYADRTVLWERIDRRVDEMIAQGLQAETEALMKEGVFERNFTAAQAIGYKELLGVLRGEMPLEEGVELLKTATRKYAKRQMTWFRGKTYVHWIPIEEHDRRKTFEEIVNNAEEVFFS